MTVGTEMGILCRESRLGLGCFSWTLDHVMTFPNLCVNVLFLSFCLVLFFLFLVGGVSHVNVFIYMYVSSYYVISVLL